MKRIAAVALLMTAAMSGAEPLQPGARVPDLTVEDPAGGERTIRFPTDGQPTVVVFLSTRCPVSNAYLGRLGELSRQYESQGFRFIGINATRDEAPEEVNLHRLQKKIPFPVFKDIRSGSAHRLGVSVTPEVYVAGADGTLRYHGRVDDHQNPARVTDHTLARVLDSISHSQPPPVTEAKAFGCAMPMWSEK